MRLGRREELKRLLFNWDVLRAEPEADSGRGIGRVELKEGVESTEEFGNSCCECTGRGGGDGEFGSDIVRAYAHVQEGHSRGIRQY